MIAAIAILTVLAVWVALPAISDALAWISALSARRKSPSPTAQPARLLFVVPAHDEEASIARCITSLRSQDYDPELLTVIVIADNCTDATAARALAAGAEVLERSVPDRPGKNEALAWGLERLSLADHDAVVIADADSVVAPDYAQRIAEVPHLRQTVGQTFDGTCNEFDNLLTRLSGLLIRARYESALTLKARAGLSCPLTGNGVVIGTEVIGSSFRDIETITEGWELYTKYTLEGLRTRYIEKARVYAESTRTLKQSYGQRVRWSAGRRAVLSRYAKDILTRPWGSLLQRIDLVAELSSTGPVTRGVIALAGTVGTLLLLDHPAATGIAAVFSTGVLHPAWYSILALRSHPEPFRTLLALLYLPIYAGWRLWVAGHAIVRSGTKGWHRTSRNRRAVPGPS